MIKKLQLIRSAACASVAAGSWLYKSVDLLSKDKEGKIFIWSPSKLKLKKVFGVGEREAPEQRLAELFNVNHFILSQSQPYIAPFLDEPGPMRFASKSKILARIVRYDFISTLISFLNRFTTSEIQFRINQLSKFGLIPNVITELFQQKIEGHVTIAPLLSDKDFFTIFSNPTHKSLSYWILKGEQSTWPFLCMIKNRCIIERKLYHMKLKLEGALKMTKEKKPSFEDLGLMLRNRTSST